MTQYWVSYPIAGRVSVSVEADSVNEAIEKGWDLTDKPEADVYWEPLEHIVTGNVFHGDTNEISVDEE